jgi:hypothetical protein
LDVDSLEFVTSLRLETSNGFIAQSSQAAMPERNNFPSRINPDNLQALNVER